MTWNIPANLLNVAIQNTAEIIQRCSIQRFVLPQLIYRRTGDMVLVDQCIC